MFQVYASIRRPEYRLVKRTSAPLPSWADPDAWRLLTERDDVSAQIREHCDRYGFYVSAKLFPLEPASTARLMAALAAAVRTAQRL